MYARLPTWPLRLLISRTVSGTVAQGKAIMRARQLIDNASFGPDALKVMGEAFDAAWAEIADTYGNDPVVI